jgi:phosphopantetheinyl transferase (holo-ACP synthase)
MKPKIVFKKIKNKKVGIRHQKTVANSLVFNLTGEETKHSSTGRPFVDKPVDLSISHKDDLVCVGTIPNPYKIGIDVEHLFADIKANLFLGTVITKKETPLLKKFCKKSGISVNSGVAIFWSVKEAFFKCLDYDLKPGKISILNISKDKIKFGFSVEIRKLMKEKKLEFYFAKATFDEKHIYSQVVMKGQYA